MSLRKYISFIAIGLVVFGGALQLLNTTEKDALQAASLEHAKNVLCNVDADCAEFEQELKRRGTLLVCESLACSQSQHLCMRVDGTSNCCDDDRDCNVLTNNKCAVLYACESNECVVSNDRAGNWCEGSSACSTGACDGQGNCAAQVLDYMIGKDCNDEDACTMGDVCDSSGACVGFPLCMDKPCENGECKECGVDTDCDDYDDTTTNVCVDHSCKYEKIEESNSGDPPEESDELPENRCGNGADNPPQCDRCPDGRKPHYFFGCAEQHGGPCRDRGGDSDDDGICNDVDPCPTMADVEPDGPNGCVPKDCEGFGGDTDGDGMCNDLDPCPEEYGASCQESPPYYEEDYQNPQSGGVPEADKDGHGNRPTSQAPPAPQAVDSDDDSEKSTDKKTGTTRTPTGLKTGDLPKTNITGTKQTSLDEQSTCGDGICQEFETGTPEDQQPQRLYCPEDCLKNAASHPSAPVAPLPPPPPLPSVPAQQFKNIPFELPAMPVATPQPVTVSEPDAMPLVIPAPTPGTLPVEAPAPKTKDTPVTYPVLDLKSAKPFVPSPIPSNAATRRAPEPPSPPSEMPLVPEPEPVLMPVEMEESPLPSQETFESVKPDEELAPPSDVLNNASKEGVNPEYERCVFVDIPQWPFAALSCPEETSMYRSMIRWMGSLLP